MSEPVKIERVLINILSDDMEKTADFYRLLLGFEAVYESDWFHDLKHPDILVEIGIIKRDHDVVPIAAAGPPGGCYLTFVVKDVESVAVLAKSMGVQIIQGPEDTFYGQRRMLLLDPDGNTLDISSPSDKS